MGCIDIAMFRQRKKIYRKESIESLLDIIRSEPRTYEDDVLIYFNPQKVIFPVLDYLFHFYDGIKKEDLNENRDALEFYQMPGIDVAGKIIVNIYWGKESTSCADIMIFPDGSFDTHVGYYKWEWTPGLDWAYVRNHHVQG